LRSKLRDDSLKRHAAVWLEETLETGHVYYSRSRADGVWAELDAMFLAGYLGFPQIQRHGDLLRLQNLRVLEKPNLHHLCPERNGRLHSYL
jgi:hypothetical protein